MIEELNNRKQNFQKLIKQNNIHGALILQDINLLYFTNSMQVYAAYIPQDGNMLIFYRSAEERIREDCPFELNKIKSFKEIPEKIKENNLPVPEILGLEFDVLPVAIFNRVMRVFTTSKAADASSTVKFTRMIKSENELKLMKKAGEMTTSVFNEITNLIKPGKTELELSKEIEVLYRENFHLGPTRMRGFNQELFYGHVVSGKSSLTLASFDMPLGGDGVHPAFSTGASNKKIKENEPIVIDYVSNYNGYHVDTTRTFCVGNVSDNLKARYEDLLDVYNKIKSLLKPGKVCEDVYNEILNLVSEKKLSGNFMGYDGDQVRFIGHGIGLEVDEFPVVAPKFTSKLEKNVTIAFEPKMFFPDFGAIGLEDTFVITDNGCEVLVDYTTDLVEI